jgi:hypothetical protein
MILRKKFKEMASGERLFAGYEFVSIGARPEQHLHLSQIETYQKQGVVEVGKDTIKLTCLNGVKTFHIDAEPGIYCLFDDKAFPLDGDDVAPSQRGQVARDYIAAKHKGKESPDPSNPAGYQVRRYYATTLEQ